MQRLAPERWPELRPLLGPDRAGRLLAPHAISTGLGELWVDAWPDPAAFLVFVGGNLAVHGDPQAIAPGFLAQRVAELLRTWDRIFTDAPGAWEPLALEALAPLQRWPRVSLERPAEARDEALPAGEDVRRLTAEDAPALSVLDEDLHWVGDPWGGLPALAQSGRAWAAWSDDRIAAVAAPGLVGDAYEDLFVVTEPEFRGLGHCPRCAAQVVRDVAQAGKVPTWTTWPSNLASLRVAEKLGFVRTGEDHCWIAGQPLEP